MQKKAQSQNRALGGLKPRLDHDERIQQRNFHNVSLWWSVMVNCDDNLHNVRWKQLIMYQTWITTIDFVTNQVHAVCQLSRIVRVANAASPHSKIRKQPVTPRRRTDAQLTLLQIKFIFKELLKDDQHPEICDQLLMQKKAQSQTVHWAAWSHD